MTLTVCGLMIAAQLVAGTGGENAALPPAPKPVEIVVFSDFQCPFCGLFAQPLRELQTTGVDGVGVKVTFKHVPLPIHSKAQLAHQAALAAAEQGKFWDMHDLLFANQQRAQRDDLVGYAQQLGLDMPRFLSDLESERITRVIDADMAEGEKRRINGTPTFYINGQEYVGTKSLAQLKQLVSEI